MAAGVRRLGLGAKFVPHRADAPAPNSNEGRIEQKLRKDLGLEEQQRQPWRAEARPTAEPTAGTATDAERDADGRGHGARFL